MIICSNCSATNNEEDGRFCRKCGALLPVPSRSSRIRIAPQQPKEIEKKKEKKKKTRKEKKKEIDHIPAETSFFSPKINNNQTSNNLDLQEIPKIEPPSGQPMESLKSPNGKSIDLVKIDVSNIPSVISKKSTRKETKILKEIAPKPFNGSIIASKGVYGPPKPKPDKQRQMEELTPNSAAIAIPEDKAPRDDLYIKQKRLEEDMSEVLSVLSKKLKVPKEEKTKSKSLKGKKSKQKIPPANMNEILKELLSLDLHIEASAILKGDKILASAISSRISETLLPVIGQNLLMIGSDIIEGLSAGKLKSISLKGTEGILDLAPIDIDIPSLKDMILIIFSHPKVKSGIISFAVYIVKKQLKEYLKVSK